MASDLKHVYIESLWKGATIGQKASEGLVGGPSVALGLFFVCCTGGS